MVYALHVIIQNLINDLLLSSILPPPKPWDGKDYSIDYILELILNTPSIIQYHDTIGTLLLILSQIPYNESIAFIDTISKIVISKFNLGNVAMYASFLCRVVKQLTTNGLLVDTSIVNIRKYKYYQPDLESMEVEQVQINIWSVPPFLWQDRNTFEYLVIPLDFISNIQGRPPPRYNTLKLYWMYYYICEPPKYNIVTHKHFKISHDIIMQKKHEEGLCQRCVWCLDI